MQGLNFSVGAPCNNTVSTTVQTPGSHTEAKKFTTAWAAGTATGTVTSRVRQAIRSLAAIGVQVTTWTLFVDSGSEYDLTCDLADAVRVETIPVEQQPRIGGISDAGSVPITHHVWRIIHICGRPRSIKFGYGAKISHNVIRCATMAQHGIGTWFDPDDKQLYLVPGRANPRHALHRHVCHQIGGLWAVPNALRGTVAYGEIAQNAIPPTSPTQLCSERRHVAATATAASDAPAAPCVAPARNACAPEAGTISDAPRGPTEYGAALPHFNSGVFLNFQPPVLPLTSQPMWPTPTWFPTPPPPVPGYVRVMWYPGTPVVVPLTTSAAQPTVTVAEHVPQQNTSIPKQQSYCVPFHNGSHDAVRDPIARVDSQRDDTCTGDTGGHASEPHSVACADPYQAATGTSPDSNITAHGAVPALVSVASVLDPNTHRHPRARFRPPLTARPVRGADVAAAATTPAPAARAEAAATKPYSSVAAAPATPLRTVRPRRAKRAAPAAAAGTVSASGAAATHPTIVGAHAEHRAPPPCSHRTNADVTIDPRNTSDRIPSIQPDARDPSAATNQVDMDGGETQDTGAPRSTASAVDDTNSPRHPHPRAARSTTLSSGLACATPVTRRLCG